MNEQTAADPEETVTETTEETVEETAAEETAAEAETAEEAADEESSSETPENKAPASVKEKALIEKVTALEDKVKRQMAEFDNFRKRTTKEKDQMFSMGEKNVIEKMLPVVDNFERGLAAIPEEEKGGALASGMEMIYKQLMKALEEMDVKPIEAVGKEFSPDFHNAVMQCEVDGVEENIIVQEFQKGYLYRGNVLRYSMVQVNK